MQLDGGLKKPNLWLVQMKVKTCLTGFRGVLGQSTLAFQDSQLSAAMTNLKSKATDAFVDEDFELALSLYDQVVCRALCPAEHSLELCF